MKLSCKCIVASVLLAVLVAVAVVPSCASNANAWVLCNPNTRVNARFLPSKNASIIGYLECGEGIVLDGKQNGEWLHAVELGMEASDGWIHKGYISDSPVIVEEYDAVGYKTVRIRNRINGKLTGTLKKGEKVTVYASAISIDGWAYTSRGYIMQGYLDDEIDIVDLGE